jgi:MFS family permease
MYVLILLGQVPCLLWMSMAEGEMRLWAACAMALVHFMSQPVYNSMIARYVPDHRRSVGYGFSNMMIFGLGAIGPTLAGYLESDRATYATLALFALVASLAALALQLRHGRAGKE